MFNFLFSGFAPRGASAVTSIADIVNPEVLADQVSAKYPDMLVLGGSGLVEVDTTFALGTPGTTFTIPFWKRIGEFGTLSEGTPLETKKITTGKEQTVVLRAGIALASYDTAALVSKSDPMTEISNQLSRRAAEYLDSQIVLKAAKTPNTLDASGTTYNTAGTIEPNAIITGMIASFGDNYGKIIGSGALVMHSKPFGDLMKLGLIQNVYQSGMDVLKTGTVPTLLGMPIFLSDRVTNSTVSSVNYYQTYVVGPGSLALFFQRNVKVEFDRDILSQEDIIVATVHFAPHLFGWDDVSDAQTAEDKKSIHVLSIKTK